MGRIIERMYSLDELVRIENILQARAGGGNPMQYAVSVDGLQVIPRTSDPESFASLEQYIDPEATRRVCVKLYGADPRHSNKIVLVLGGNTPKGGTLQGIRDAYRELATEQEKATRGAVARAREKWAFEDLEKKHLELGREYKELEEYAAKIEEELKGYRGKKFHWGDLDLAEVLAGVAEAFIRNNADSIGRLTGSETLAGLIREDTQRKKEALAGPGQSGAGQTPTRQDELSAKWAGLGDALRFKLGDGGFAQIMEATELVGRHPALVPYAASAIQGWIKDIQERLRRNGS